MNFTAAITRINLLLLVAVLLTALFVVHTQYESRRIFVELEKASAQGRKLETDSRTLQAERRSQATPLRVDQLAKDKLQMVSASAAITQYVATHPAAANAATAAAAAAAPGKP